MPSKSDPHPIDGFGKLWMNFKLFIEFYMICRYFSHIEYVLMIHLVKVSLIFIKYELSTEPSKGLAHIRVFVCCYTLIFTI